MGNHATFELLFYLKLVSAIFYQIFIFHIMIPIKNSEKCFLFHLKGSFRSGDIQIFVLFPLPFYNFQIQKGQVEVE